MAEGNANERAPGKKIREYSNPFADGFGSSIVRPPVEANSFELKPSMIQMIQHRTQFAGLPNEDPNQHISDFIELCDTVKYPGVILILIERQSQGLVTISSDRKYNNM